MHSPRVLITKRPIDCDRQCTVPFGTCVQAVHESKPTNTLASPSLDAICLSPMDSDTGGHVVMNLATGKELAHPKVIPVQMPDSVVM